MYTHGEGSFKRALSEIDEALVHCEQSGLLYPTLILVYSLMDSFSYIHRPNPNDQRAQFEDFVNNWVLPHDQIKCTSLDLYAARNGVLHRLGMQSKIAEQGKANTIAYCKGDADFDGFDQFLETERKILNKSIPLVKVEALVDAVRTGISNLLKSAESDSQLKKQLEDYFAYEHPYRFDAWAQFAS